MSSSISHAAQCNFNGVEKFYARVKCKKVELTGSESARKWSAPV